MCSELFRIPYEWGGVPIFGFGVLLAILIVGGVIGLALLARRHGLTAEVWSTLPMLLLVGAAIVMLPRLFPGGLPIRGYGVMLLIGVVSGVWLGVRRSRQGGIDSELIISLAIWLVICGVVGARLFYIIEYWDEKFAGRGLRDTLLEIINVPQGGLVIYGGFFGAAVAFISFTRKHRLPLLAMADIAAPCMMIGLAFGRMGCLLNGCCYGGPTDVPWHVTFPRDSPPYADQASRGELLGFRLESRGEDPAVVVHIDSGSPADAAGLRSGDRVAAVGGQPVRSLTDARDGIFKIIAAGQPLILQLHDNRTIRLSTQQLPARSLPVHPAQVYSAIDAALLCWLTWAYFPFRRRDGECIALLLTIHPITRFLLEIIRTDEPSVFNTGLSISQNISIGLLVVAGGIWWYLSRQPRGVTWPLVSASSVASPRGHVSPGGKMRVSEKRL